MEINLERSSIPAIKDKIGNLEIKDIITQGGQGIIYKAYHIELEIYRAIKLLKTNYQENEKERFLTEAKISAHLNHPNIVQIFNSGIVGSQPYLEMEYVDGKSLFQIINENKIHPIVAASIAIIVAKALEYAYEQKITVYGKEYRGLVHRDIKPQNILIGNDGVTKLADFGIALPGGVSIHTADMQVSGSMNYVSPEQINRIELDQRTDIYSLGCVLYEMITGKKTFDGENFTDLISDKIKGRYEKLKNNEIPKSIISIVDKCIAPDREKRFKTVEELHHVLSNCIGQYTEETPSEIVKLWILEGKIPQKSPALLIKTVAEKKIAIFPLMVIILGVAIVISGYLWIVKEIFINKNDLKLTDKNPFEVIASTENSLKIEGNSIEDNKEKSNTLLSENKQNTSIVKKGIKTNLVEKLTSFSSQIDLRKDSIKAIKDTQQKDKTPLEKLISAYKNGNLILAEKHLNSIDSTDAVYLLVKGRKMLNENQINEAEPLLLKAVTVPTRTKINSRKEAVYWYVKVREEIYKQNPNYENKTTLMRMLKTFDKSFCSNRKDKYCKYIQSKLEELDTSISK